MQRCSLARLKGLIAVCTGSWVLNTASTQREAVAMTFSGSLPAAIQYILHILHILRPSAIGCSRSARARRRGRSVRKGLSAWAMSLRLQGRQIWKCLLGVSSASRRPPSFTRTCFCSYPIILASLVPNLSTWMATFTRSFLWSSLASGGCTKKCSNI